MSLCLNDSVLYHVEASQFHEVLFIVNLSANANNTLFRKSFPVPMSSRIFSFFFSIRFSVSGFRLRSLAHLEMSFVRVISIYFLFLCMQTSSLSNIICWKCWLFWGCIFGFLIKIQVSIGVWIYGWFFKLIHQCIFSGQFYAVLLLQLCSTIWDLGQWYRSFIVQDCFSYPGF